MKSNYKINMLPKDCYKKYMEIDKDMPAFFYEQLLEEKRTVYLYSENEINMGEIALVSDTEDREYTISGQRAYLSRLVVSKEYRNKGIGTILIQYICKKAKLEGYKEISLGVYKDNEPAMHLYNKYGFDIVLNEVLEGNRTFIKLMKVL